MFKFLRYSLILCCLALAACQGPKLQDLNGNSFRLSDYHGKWVLINYWASWCKPCTKEVPELNALQQAYPKQVVVLGFSYDQVPFSKLPAIVSKMQIAFPTLKQDPKQLLGVNNIAGLPATLLIDPDGKLKSVLLGPQTQAQLESHMQLQ